MVKTGYAFALNGNYLGVIAYNGKVMEGAKEIARYRADGNIVNNENEVIGFAVSMSATVNDNAGRYLGRVLPKGIVANGAEIIGHVGAKGFVFDIVNHVRAVFVAGRACADLFGIRLLFPRLAFFTFAVQKVVNDRRG